MVICAQSSLMLLNPMNCSLLGSSILRIYQARILQWVAISSSRGPTQGLHLCLCASCIVRPILYHCTTWEAPYL